MRNVDFKEKTQKNKQNKKKLIFFYKIFIFNTKVTLTSNFVLIALCDASVRI
jgi:hypothetical protein